MWNEKLVEGLAGSHIVNDSKTPSGRVHVGSLRGVLIHDAIYRSLISHGFDAKFTYGIDDFDPLDGLPADAQNWVKEYMGHPLCNVPAPAGSTSSDLANHYIAEFLDIFTELGVNAEIYRMRDVYRSGRLNESIDTILKNSDKVRQIYAKVSKANKTDDWLPFQVICEKCGKLGTTEVSHYDGKEVEYECKPNLVKWATGCGHRGKVSPFDGKGKLPWKLEWVAKWHCFGITIEGAGKDHCTKGGSREVAVACLKSIFGEKPPLNVPYEFFLVSGAKMSSSKGVGTSARDMADLLPPEILRYLMIRTPPKKTVNFSSDFDYIVKLFNEHDRLIESNLSGRATDDQKETLASIEVDPHSTAYHPVGFQLLSALLQLPHIDIETEIERRTAGGLSASDKLNLQKRIKAARYWLDNFAADEDRVELQMTLPASISQLSETQRAFLHLLGQQFPQDPLSENDYQAFIFTQARLTPIKQPLAFSAIYRALLDKDQGPKGGSLFSYLERNFLVDRLMEITYTIDGFWQESSISKQECHQWISKYHSKIDVVSYAFLLNALLPSQHEVDKNKVHGSGVCEILVTLNDNKEHMLRVSMTDFENDDQNFEHQLKQLEVVGMDFINGLEQEFNLTFKQRQETIISKETRSC